MKHLIDSEICCTRIITYEKRRIREKHAKITKKVLNPREFRNSVSYSTIFGFSA